MSADTTLSCLALVGPTASGKTALALEVARHWPVEIISVDSALVYRGMDIGTAKPNAEEQTQVRHHLIDIRDPLDAYSAAETSGAASTFFQIARSSCDRETARTRAAATANTPVKCPEYR